MNRLLKKTLSVLLVLTTLVAVLTSMTTAYASRTMTYKNTIMLGDSRSVGTYNTFNGTKLTAVNKQDSNAIWYAKNGTTYSWFKETALPAVDKKVSSGRNVIILMGVNDIKRGYTSNLSKYIYQINKKAYTWAKEGAHTFVVSVNPVGKTGTGKNGSYTFEGLTITNKKNIANWNATLKKGLSSDVTYIDTYSDIIGDFQSTDGIHYTATTYKEIFSLITTAVKNDSDMTISRSGLAYTTKKGWSKVSYTGFIYSDISGLKGWAYIVDGTADTDYTGLAKGCAKGVTGWYYVKNGLINFSYTGKASNKNGTYYVKNGYVNTSYSGTVKINGKSVKVVNGKIS